MSACELHLLLKKIHQYEPGIYDIISDMVGKPLYLYKIKISYNSDDWLFHHIGHPDLQKALPINTKKCCNKGGKYEYEYGYEYDDIMECNCMYSLNPSYVWYNEYLEDYHEHPSMNEMFLPEIYVFSFQELTGFYTSPCCRVLFEPEKHIEVYPGDYLLSIQHDEYRELYEGHMKLSYYIYESIDEVIEDLDLTNQYYMEDHGDYKMEHVKYGISGLNEVESYDITPLHWRYDANEYKTKYDVYKYEDLIKIVPKNGMVVFDDYNEHGYDILNHIRPYTKEMKTIIDTFDRKKALCQMINEYDFNWV